MNTKAYSEATYQKILSNSTEGTGSYATVLAIGTPNTLKYIQGDSNRIIANAMTRITSGWVDEHVLVQLSPDITCTTLSVPAISPPATGNLTLNGYGPIKLVLASTGVSVTGTLQANNGILADQITPSLNGSLQLNGNDTNTKIVLGTGTVAITGTTVTIAGNVSMPGYLWAGGLVSASGGKVVYTGQVTWSVTKAGTGLYTISCTTSYPGGSSNYIISVTGHASLACVRGASYVTNTSFQVATYALGPATLADSNFCFMVLAS